MSSFRDPSPRDDLTPSGNTHSSPAVLSDQSPPIDHVDTRLSAGEKTVVSIRRPTSRSTETLTQEEALGIPHDPSNYLSTTSHSRRDLFSGDWTIFAPVRDQRPNEYAGLAAPQVPNEPKQLSTQTTCPFCVGNEQETPQAVWSAKLTDDQPVGRRERVDNDHLLEDIQDSGAPRIAPPVLEIRSSDQPDWDVRVVPNKFPAVSPLGVSPSEPVDRSVLFPTADIVGGHEVVIESSLHAEAMSQLDSASVLMTLMAYRDRIRHWKSVEGIEYISVFKNCGLDAGASLKHSHSQIIATSLMPHHVRTRLLRSETHHARTGSALGCDLVREEITEKTRLIDRTDNLVAFCPFASPFAGMIRISSLAHQPCFEQLSDTTLDHLASFLWRVLGWVGDVFPGKAYNYLLHTCPPSTKRPEAFQWSIDLFPRVNKIAGFEQSSHCMINGLLPEIAAARYRMAACGKDPRQLLAR